MKSEIKLGKSEKPGMTTKQVLYVLQLVNVYASYYCIIFILCVSYIFKKLAVDYEHMHAPMYICKSMVFPLLFPFSFRFVVGWFHIVARLAI